MHNLYLERKKAERDSILRYEMAKREWIQSHRNATHKEYEQAMRELARKAGV